MSRTAHSFASPEALLGPAPLLRTFPTAAVIMRDDAGGTAAALLAHAALETALAGLVRPNQRAALERAVPGRCEHEGGAPAQASRPSPPVAPRTARSRDRRDWAAHESCQADVADAVSAYTHVLRSGGVPLAASLIAVAAVVDQQAAARLPVDVCNAVQRDAARSCIAAFFGP
jgi:hypothetical protein